MSPEDSTVAINGWLGEYNDLVNSGGMVFGNFLRGPPWMRGSLEVGHGVDGVVVCVNYLVRQNLSSYSVISE